MCPIILFLKFNFVSEGTFGLSCSVARGIFSSPTRENPLHWKVKSQPQDHQGNPDAPHLTERLEGAQGHMESNLRGVMRSQSPASKPLCSKKVEDLLKDPY